MIGIDIVDVARFGEVLERAGGLEERLFTKSERAYCDTRGNRTRHLAGTLAAKEAVIKAARLGSLVAWARRIEISRGTDGAPQAAVKDRRDLEVSLSISHDMGWAAAAAVLNRSRNSNLQGWLP